MKNRVIDFLNKYKIVILLFIGLFGILGYGTYTYFFAPFKVTKNFNSIDLDGYDKLMIVAHPDDEMLWGGAHLIEDNYLVVCVTCGGVKERVNEFKNVMASTNDKYILLGYPDKTNGERDNWDLVYESIKEDIQNIVALKEWNTIVTHNPQGEYGHVHHKMTNQITTSVVEDKTKLYYFGRYHSKKKITEFYSDMVPINDKYIKQKRDILGLYKSQYFIQTSFDHMFDYEDWESYEEWRIEE